MLSYIKKIAIVATLLSILIATTSTADEPQPVGWRCDPDVPRHPGSYFGGGVGYNMSHMWAEPTDDHGELAIGPVHSWQAFVRVGDAFTEWFSLGFHILMSYGKNKSDLGTRTQGAFALMLDTTFYPVAGLSLRPSVGIGLAYVQDVKEYDFSYGGPVMLSMAASYEFRVTKHFYISPIVQTFWITKKDEGYDGMYLFFGFEFLRWFDTPTG